MKLANDSAQSLVKAVMGLEDSYSKLGAQYVPRQEDDIVLGASARATLWDGRAWSGNGESPHGS